MRKAKGDIKTASALFAQAEKAAPTDFKPQSALAEKTPSHKLYRCPNDRLIFSDFGSGFSLEDLK